VKARVNVTTNDDGEPEIVKYIFVQKWNTATKKSKSPFVNWESITDVCFAKRRKKFFCIVNGENDGCAIEFEYWRLVYVYLYIAHTYIHTCKALHVAYKRRQKELFLLTARESVLSNWKTWSIVVVLLLIRKHVIAVVVSREHTKWRSLFCRYRNMSCVKECGSFAIEQSVSV
jgi:hypothetical protein